MLTTVFLLMEYQREWLLAVPLHTKSAVTSALNMLNKRVEMCGPAPIVVELEQTLCMISLVFNKLM